MRKISYIYSNYDYIFKGFFFYNYLCNFNHIRAYNFVSISSSKFFLLFGFIKDNIACISGFIC